MAYSQEKDNVIISHWFTRSWITESIRQLYKSLHDEYNVVVFDNAWHWNNKNLSFTIDNQKKILENVLHHDSVKNSNNHLMINCLPWFLTIQNLLIEQQLLENFKSITLSAPVIDIKSAINRNFETLWISENIWNILLKSGLLNLFLKMKWVNANAITIDQLHHEYTPDDNINTLQSLGESIPLHIVCNSWDSINNNLLDTIWHDKKVNITAQHTDRHHVYFQEAYDYSTLPPDQQKTNPSIGSLVKQFIHNNS